MSQIHGGGNAETTHQLAIMTDEIGRLRRLCLKLLNEHNDGAGGRRLSQIQSDEIKASLTGAWEELERKQSYLETVNAEVMDLREKLSELREQKTTRPPNEVEMLTASLHEAWAEIERKQGYLETAVAEGQALQQEVLRLSSKT
jgi:predicted nuclease with TOPRIM domain